jgi:hypothetical protein
MLFLEFEEYAVNTIQPETTTRLTYFVDYYEDTTQARTILLTFFVILNIWVLTMVGCKMRVFMSHNPQATFVTKANEAEVIQTSRYLYTMIGQLIFLVLDVWATYVNYFCVVVCGYWFIMYKMQDNAHLLMPSKEESLSLESVFIGVFITMFVAKNLAVIY